jgi:SAM-dependent methyltransferase
MRSNAEWVFWGKHDPLWAVASHPGRERAGANPWKDADFYRDGEADWRGFLRHWEKFGINRRCCVEIGCGAGRMTRALARTFERVHGVDVSPGMLEYARSHVTEPNIEFHLGDGQRIPLPDGSVTAVFSTHVFQHFESAPDSVPVFEDVARVLEPGGSVMIHLPLYLYPHPSSRLTRFVRMEYAARKKLADAVAAWKRWQLKRNKDVPLMRGTYYDVQWLYELLLGLGMEEVEFSMVAAQPKAPLHPMVLARKAAP